MSMRWFCKLLSVGLVSCLVGASQASAGTILVFGQTSTAPASFTATASGSTTTLSATDIAVNLTNLNGVGASLPAYFNLNATNVSAATVSGGYIVESFKGTFEIYSKTGETGTNYLSGTFTGTLSGAENASSLTFNASSTGTGQALTFTSAAIPYLASPRGMSLSFTDVTPVNATTGNPATIGGFTSNVGGTFSAVPEPTSALMLGMGAAVLGLGAWRKRAARVS